MQRPLLADGAKARLGRLSLEERRRDLPLVGDDDHEDVGRHHGAGNDPHMNEGATPREDMREDIGEGEDEREDACREQRRVPPDGRTAEPVIDRPAQDDGNERDEDRGPGGDVEHRRVDQVGARIEIVDDGEQQEARDPGEISLPLEPGEMLRQARGCGEVFLDVVEAAAVHLPCLAAHAIWQIAARLEREVERHEIERGADPRDPGDHVAPADQEVQPVGDEGLEHGLSRMRLPGIVSRGRRWLALYGLTAAACRRCPSHTSSCPGCRHRAAACRPRQRRCHPAW